MNDERSFERTARAWLESGVNQAPDRAVQAVLLAIETTPQERDLRIPWRFPTMNTPFRVAAAAVIGVMLLGGAAYLFGGGGPNIGGPASPTPSPSPSPSPAPSPTPALRQLPQEQTVLEAGTYVAGDPFGVPVSLTVPGGWIGRVGGPYLAWVAAQTGNQAEISLSLFDKVFADPCHYTQGFVDPLPGPTVEALATALADMPALDVTTPTDVTVDGYRGKQLTMTAPASRDGCAPAREGFAVWQLPLGAINAMSPGQRQRVWILDVAGQRLVIAAAESPDSTGQERAEIEAILDSIQIEPSASQPSPSVSP